MLTCLGLVALVAYIHVVSGTVACMWCQLQASRGMLRLLVPDLYVESESVCWCAFGAQHQNAMLWLAAMPAESFLPALCRSSQGHTCVGASCHLCSEDSSCYIYYPSQYLHMSKQSAFAHKSPASMSAQSLILLIHTRKYPVHTRNAKRANPKMPNPKCMPIRYRAAAGLRTLWACQTATSRSSPAG